ncbi:MFS transporter [Sphingomonas abietis]|uniref:MFS transporter n=1 Tax=Sphingomonas abietis TaxID=3012344 RepID=A0ABY7NLW7_9SPHN|nr:MFS transporter [Sphingomonas abietis]WBO21965.1 MFS transporter [Sphingomonas abietis]
MNQPSSRRGAAGVAVAATIGNMVGITPAVSATFGVFLVPIATDFGWARATVSGVFGLIALVSAITYPIVGRLMDRYGSRKLLIGGNLLLAGSIALLALSTQNVLLFYLLFGLVGLAGSIPSTAMFCKVVSNWFDETRGLMLGVTAGIGNGVGATIMPIVAGLLLGVVGWRGSFVAIGGIVLAVGFPTLFLLIRDAPRPAVAHPVQLEGMSLSQAARTRPFWIMLAAVAAGGGGMTAVFTHVVPMLTDHGVSVGEATMIIAIFALVAAGWQIVTGWTLDRLRTPRVVMPMYLSAIVGLSLLEFGHGTPTLVLAGVLLGIGLGAEYGALPYFISRYFGLRCYGSITGALYAVVIFVQGITPGLMDVGFGATGSYAMPTLAIGAALIVGAALLSLLPPLEMLTVRETALRGVRAVA